MRMKFLAVVLLLTCGASIIASARSVAQERFLKANDLYTAGNFAEAISEYKDILSHGQISAEVLYNLGSSYYKFGEIGFAILYYEKALRMKPRDADIKANLNFINASFFKEKSQKGAVETILDWFLKILSINEITIILLAVYTAFFALLIIMLYYSSFTVLWCRRFVLLVLFMVSIWWYGVYYSSVKQKYAIITAHSVQVKSGPGDNFTVGFSMPEGRKALILKKHEDWYEIGLKSEGLRGWIKRSELSEI